jgi:hypothetical protein
MSTGGGGGTQTTTSNAEPWKASQPYLTDAMRQAQQLAGRGVGGMPSTVAGFDPATQAGLGMIENRAGQPDPLAGQAQNAVGGLLGAVNPGAGYVDQVATGQTPLGSTQGRGIFDAVARGQGINPNLDPIAAGGLDTLGATARGDYLNSNPNLDRAFDAGARKITDAVSSRFFGQGGGSGYQQRILQEGLGDLAAQTYMPAYENERGRQMQASGLLPQLQQQDIATRLGAGGLLEGVAGQDVATRMGAADLSGNLQGRNAATTATGVGLLPGLRDYQNAGAQDLLTVGATRENLQNEQLADQMMRYQQPWNDLMNYSGVLSGFGGLGGTQTSTGPKQRTNPFLGAAAGAAGLAPLGPWGAAAGGLLGLLGGGG